MVAQIATPQLPIDTILHGDSLEVLRSLPDACVDAIVTDPPAGISFMDKGWDSDKGGRDAWIAWLSSVMAEALRVLKPGGHALVWALPRTSHWTAMALEDAGFEVRDCCAHLFGSGFPKSLDVSKAIDKAAGAKRKGKGINPNSRPNSAGKRSNAMAAAWSVTDITAPATDAAQQWDGWGTALKPAAEFWWLCRKPLAEGTVAGNVLTWGTGALNIGASRVNPGAHVEGGGTFGGVFGNGKPANHDGHNLGRWPANLLLSHSLWCDETACALDCPIRALDAQSGIRTSGLVKAGTTRRNRSGFTGNMPTLVAADSYGDTGGASRFFQTFRYQPKASRAERNRGCSSLPKQFTATMNDGVVQRHHSPDEPNAWNGNHHPTVKPLALMSWLIGLITPPSGLVLDPFAGSGSTLVAAKEGGWRYLGIEREAEYVAIAQARLNAPSAATPAATPAKPKRMRTKKQPQPTLLEAV